MPNRALVTALVLTFLAGAALAQHPQGRNAKEMKMRPFPGLPTCTTGSVQSGDPTKGPSVIYAKVNGGCTIPWHWHTPTETLMIVSGTATVEAKGEKAYKLSAGGFAQLPSHHTHQFSCKATCTFFVSSDAAFDIHYVDKDGKELSPAAALKKLNETAATAQ